MKNDIYLDLGWWFYIYTRVCVYIYTFPYICVVMVMKPEGTQHLRSMYVIVYKLCLNKNELLKNNKSNIF